jgi:hypothetical protein
MWSPPNNAVPAVCRLRTSRVLRVHEDVCEIWSCSGRTPIRFAPMFPSPRMERVSPGHLVAVATGPGGSEAVVWRWYDAVVLGQERDGAVWLWEPAHGEISAQPRASYEQQEPGTRAYASAGLPGAEWWVAASADSDPQTVNVDLDEVDNLYNENELWLAVFAADL